MDATCMTVHAGQALAVMRVDRLALRKRKIECFNCKSPSAALNSLILPLMPAATTVVSFTKPKFFNWLMR